MEKRKAFNFYRSYYEMFLELNPEQGYEFLKAVLIKQFEGKDPKDLKGIAGLLYKSQAHSIDAQRKGWEDKVKSLKNSTISGASSTTTVSESPYYGGSEGGAQGGIQGPKAQVQEKGKEKEKEQTSVPVLFSNEELQIPFTKFWELYDKKVGKPQAEKLWKKVKPKDKEQIIKSLPAYIVANPEKRYRKNPATYLNQRSWEDEIIQSEKTLLSEPAKSQSLKSLLNGTNHSQ